MGPNRMSRTIIGSLLRWVYRVYVWLSEWVSLPLSTLTILDSPAIHRSYKMSVFRKLRLGFRMFTNTRRVTSGTSYKAHLVMARRILETPPEVEGDVIECGTWKGGSAVNLSLVCRIVGRRLKVCDSFEGLPEPKPGEHLAKIEAKGAYSGTLDEVMSNIQRYGAIENCQFVKGWFEDTLPELSSPLVLAFLDVDFEASLHTCVRHIWPNLVEQGYMFTDEAVLTDYVALFYSEKWWRKYFGATPPGLIGAGTGLPLGQFYIGPWLGFGELGLQRAIGVAYTQKSMSGNWTYYPDEE